MTITPTDTAPVDVEGSPAGKAEAFFKALDKALKACQLYESKGKLVDRMLDDLMPKLEAATAPGALTVKVASFGLVFEGTPLNLDDKRKPYLFRLFCDGVRELSLLKGMDRDEVMAFIDILMADPKAGEDDLVTLLWERNLPHVSLYVADTFSSVLDTESAGQSSLLAGESRVRINPEGKEEEALPLSPDDVRALKPGEDLVWLKETRAIAEPSPKLAGAAGKVREAFQSTADFRQFFTVARKLAERHKKGDEPLEASPLILGQFDASVKKGHADQVAQMLELAGLAVERSGEFGKVLQAALTDEERMKALAGLYERSHAILTPALKGLVKGGEDGMIALLGELPTGEAQRALQEMLTAEGVDLTPFYSQRLASEDEQVLLDTIDTLSRIGTEPALAAIAKTLGSPLTAVRHAALKALVGRYTESARIGLGRALKDPSQENRMLALKILRESGEPRVAWAIISTLDEPSFEQRDKDEQAAFYEALAAFQDDRTLGHFKELFAKKNLFRSRSIINRQLMAVEALGKIGTDHARELLADVRKRWYIPGKVKRAIDAGLSRAGGAA